LTEADLTDGLADEINEERLDLQIGVARDIEDSDVELDSYGDTPLNFWENKQRDIVTSVVDYNLATLAGLVANHRIDLSPRYQRRHRWNAARQSKLIESFLMNVPVPPVFLNEDNYGRYSVIDGKQRLFAINEFLRGRLRLTGLHVFHEINGKTFDDLPGDLQAVIETRGVLRAVIVLRQSSSDIKFEVFQRLNTGGVRLNPQEIRNSTYPGTLNNVILDLSENADFRRLLRVKDERTSAIVREMRDAELVLRYFTFSATWETFSSGMMRHMDEHMSSHQEIATEDAAKARSGFLTTLRAVEAAFGDFAFRRWVPEKGTWRDQVLASLFDAEMLAAQDWRPEQLAPHRAQIVAGLQELFTDKDFRKSIDAATNTPALFRARILAIRSLLEAVAPGGAARAD
jgi:hypothetical protein